MGTMRLPTPITDEDRLNIQRDQSEAIKAQEGVEATKKEAVRGFNGQIKHLKQTIHEKNEVLVSGMIYREVEVEARKDAETGKAETYRLDTNTLVRSQDIDPDERQVLMSLPMPGETPASKKRDISEEQNASTPEEAEKLREERLAEERVERISAVVSEARGRITVLPTSGPGAPPNFHGTVQVGDRVVEADAESAEDVVAKMVTAITELAEADEASHVATWDDLRVEAGERQREEEIAKLAADQADDQKKNGPKNLLRSSRPKKEKKISVTHEGRELDEDGNVKAEPEKTDGADDTLAF